MARRKMDILLVRKDAPVQRMRLGPWLIYVVLLLICLTVAGLGAGGYLLYQQNQALKSLVQDNRRMQLVSRNLESMLRDLQDRAVLTAQPPTVSAPATAAKPRKPNLAPEPKPEPIKPQPAPEPKPEPIKPQPAPEPKPEPIKPTPAPEPKPEAPKAESKADPEPSPQSASAAPEPVSEKETPRAAPQAQDLEPWPTNSDWVDIRKISTKRTRRELIVYFNVTNKLESKSPAEGYVAVILRGERKGAPWLEAWPPTRLTPLGRPESFKKTAAFEVRRYRRLRARFAMVDKDVDILEFLVYTKEGDLALLIRHPLGGANKNS